MVDQIIDMITERAAELTKRAGEDGEVATVVIEGGAEDELPIGRFAEVVADGLDRFNEDLERANEMLDRIYAGEESPEFEDLGRQIKTHGREIYDAVVDLEGVVDQALDLFESQPRDDEILQRLEALVVLGAMAERGRGPTEEVYRMFEGLDEVSPFVRTQVRNMRSGVRDSSDARGVVAEWGERAAAIAAGGS